MNQIETFTNLLSSGQDSPLLRFGLGSALFKEGRFDEASTHLAAAVEQDPGYSAAWKLYGKALAEAGRADEAESAYQRGIAIATEKGDLQAAKEMQVFLKRLQKQH